MAIARTTLIQPTNSASPIVGGTSTTASVSNTANALLLLSISFGDNGGAPVKPTSVTGLGLTWTEVNSAVIGNVGCIVYRALGPASTGALTINWAAGTDSGIWALEQFTGVNTTTPVIQSKTSAANIQNPTLTLDATPAIRSWTFGALANNSTTQTTTAGTNFVENTTTDTNTNPSQSLSTETNSNASPNTTVAWTTSGAANKVLVGVEIGVVVHSAVGTGSGVGGNGTVNARVLTPIKLDIFSDNFNDNSLDTAKWSVVDAAGGTITEESQQLWFNLPDPDAAIALQSDNVYDLAGNTFSFQLVDPGDHLNLDQIAMHLLGSVEFLSWQIQGGNIRVLDNFGLAWDDPFDFDVHKWFRIRESAGTLYWDYSTDGITWTNAYSEATAGHGAINDMAVYLSAAGATLAADTIVKIDNFSHYEEVLGELAAATGTGVGGTGTVSAIRTTFGGALGAGVGGTGTVSAVRIVIVAGTGAGLGSGIALAISWNPIAMPEVFIYLETEEDVWVSIGDDNRSGGTTRGRQRELDKFQTGTCFITQSNADRKYDVTYEASPLYGYLKPNRRIKVEAVQDNITYPIFMGYIDGISEQSNGPHDAVVTITLSDALKVLNRYTINGTSFDSELPGERITALLDLIEYPVGLRDIDDGTETLQALTDVASTLLSHAETVALTEFGDFFVMADGTFRFKGRDAAIDEPLQGEFGSGPGEIPYRSLSPEYDDLLIRNPVTVDRVDGTAQTVEDTGLTAPPPAGYGVNHFTLSGTYHDSDANAEDAAAYILQRYKEPKRRISGLTLGPPPVGFEAVLFPQMLGRDLTEKVMIVERPQNVPPEIRQASVIEGISHSWSAKYWATTWNVSPGFVIGTEYWRIGTPGSSEIGLTTKVYF